MHRWPQITRGSAENDDWRAIQCIHIELQPRCEEYNTWKKEEGGGVATRDQNRDKRARLTGGKGS